MIPALDHLGLTNLQQTLFPLNPPKSSSMADATAPLLTRSRETEWGWIFDLLCSVPKEDRMQLRVPFSVIYRNGAFPPTSCEKVSMNTSTTHESPCLPSFIRFSLNHSFLPIYLPNYLSSIHCPPPSLPLHVPLTPS